MEQHMQDNWQLVSIFVSVALFLFNGVLGIAMWLLKQSYSEVKEQLKNNSTAIDNVKEHYFKKEDFKAFKDDFREFREELWKRFDKLETRVEDKKDC
jgi:hypothetical protein